jgi:glycosyltransferase involved in cell wall biosynthesis
MKRLLLVGSNTIHTYNYHQLISDYFDEILVITDKANDYLKEIRCEEVRFSIRNPLYINKSLSDIHKIFLAFKPDIIHIQQAGTESWLTLRAARKIQIPKIVTAWGSDILITPQMGFLYKKMIKYILEKADYFTCDSLYVASRMQELAAPQNLDITVANFGINIKLEEILKEKIIYSNRLHKELYRIDKIIKAFYLFNQRNKEEGWKLVIAGEGEETGNLKSLADKLGIADHVRFVGWIDHESNSEYYNKSLIYVSIPESDATSISLLEAMAAGCIPVVSDLPANKEWITDGKNGVIVKDEKENFLDKVLQLDIDEVKKFNKELIKQRGTKEANRKKFFEVYKKALSGK